jgi:NAD(P)-dependent dehydrogenase (short-subunit alcohol dehydrogenase family)/acyl carrier protein
LGARIAEYLRGNKQEVITVKAGEHFSRIGDGIYTVDPKETRDYEELMRALQAAGKLPKKIVHLWGVSEGDLPPSGRECFEHSQDLGFYSLIFLAQALSKAQVSEEVQLDVVTSRLHEVTGEEEPLVPGMATLLAPCMVIPQEYPNITCRNIDLGPVESEERRVEQVLGEMTGKVTDPVVAFRGKHRWVQRFEPAKGQEAAGSQRRLKEQGVYVVTGGLGGVGMALAEYLAGAVKARLVLVGRTGLPPRDQWEQWLATHPEDDTVSLRIRRVAGLEEQGEEVLLVQADVTEMSEMQEAMDRAEKRFGSIDGVIHAAGMVTRASIQELDRDLCEEQFQAKVHGLSVLEKVLAQKDVDFCILVSSLASVLGGIGFGAYAAANLFMDAFAQRCNQSGSTTWISVNWDAWQIRKGSEKQAGPGSELAELAIHPREGGQALERILSMDLGERIVVSTGDLKARLDKWIRLESLRESEQGDRSLLYSRPALSSVYIVPGNPTEQSIAEIWQDLLRIEEVGIHDNFFELGGHSLLASQVVARLRSEFPVEFSVSTLFERPTVHSLSEMIREEQKGEASFEDSKKRAQRRRERRKKKTGNEKGLESGGEFRDI